MEKTKTEELPNGNGKKATIVRSLELAALIFSVVCSLLTVSVVVFKGGALMQQVVQNTDDIRDIKTGGSPTLRETIRALALEVESRKESDLLTNRRIDEMRQDFIGRIQEITRLLEKQIEQNGALISLIKTQQQQTK